MSVDERRLVAIGEFSDFRYVQFLAQPDGTVVTEVISNLNIGDGVALTFEQESALMNLGFETPVSERFHPNYRFESHNAAELIQSIEMITKVILDVLAKSPGETMSLNLFELPSDFTPDEIDQIREINSGAEEKYDY